MLFDDQLESCRGIATNMHRSVRTDNAVTGQKTLIATDVKDIRLADLEGVVLDLIGRIRATAFLPDVVIYLETGARIIAKHFYEHTGIPAIPLTIQRSGHKGKARVASLLRNLPRPLQNTLRRMERALSQNSVGKRNITSASTIDLTGRSILILDDACDSGATFLAAQEWVLSRGGLASDLRFASIAVTQQRAQLLVDYWIYADLCRFPWSSDSEEREEYLLVYERTDPTSFTTRSL